MTLTINMKNVINYFKGFKIETSIQTGGATTSIAYKDGQSIYGTFAIGIDLKCSFEKMQDKINK